MINLYFMTVQKLQYQVAAQIIFYTGRSPYYLLSAHYMLEAPYTNLDNFYLIYNNSFVHKLHSFFNKFFGSNTDPLYIKEEQFKNILLDIRKHWYNNLFEHGFKVL
jgi:hypothetical protein